MYTNSQTRNYLEKLEKILTPNELVDLVQAFETVITFRNGFGEIDIIIKQKRISQIGLTSTIKPSNQ